MNLNPRICRPIARLCVVVGVLCLIADAILAGVPGHRVWVLVLATAISGAGAIGGGLIYLRSARRQSCS